MGWKIMCLYLDQKDTALKKHTEKYLDFTVKIKINNKIESLNLSNSAAIVFNDLINGKKKIIFY